MVQMGHMPGGGGCYINSCYVSVTSDQSICVIVGDGGIGAAQSVVLSIIVGNSSCVSRALMERALSVCTSSPVSATPAK